MCITPDPVEHAANIATHIELVALARAEYAAHGIVSTDTFMAMTNAGLMADEIIADIEETPSVQ